MFAQQADQAFLSGRTMICPCLLTAAILLELEPASSEVVMTWDSDMGEDRLLGRCAESDRADGELMDWENGWGRPVRVRVEQGAEERGRQRQREGVGYDGQSRVLD